MQLPFPKKTWQKNEWQRLKNLTKINLIKLLDKDDRWTFIKVKGGRYIYHNPQYKSPHNYLAIHYHKEGFRNPGLLKDILNHWCCTSEELHKWGVI